jgi:hypothetical protein
MSHLSETIQEERAPLFVNSFRNGLPGLPMEVFRTMAKQI